MWGHGGCQETEDASDGPAFQVWGRCITGQSIGFLLFIPVCLFDLCWFWTANLSVVIIDMLLLTCCYCCWQCLVNPSSCHCVNSQAVEWLGELLDALLKTHIRLGDDSQETKVLLEKHKKFVDVAQVRTTRAEFRQLEEDWGVLSLPLLSLPQLFCLPPPLSFSLCFFSLSMSFKGK